MVHPGKSKFLIDEVRYLEYENIDFAPTLAANLNQSSPFLNSGIINIYQIV